ncbi:stigma-specific STIG1-like protein 4 [Malania oleifera]|uniref:stigma-specific STIG1-like protein 4 n=1 Tax=Malania oleifera TaxID=397392 RepID=UPI0025ADC797|nr:stigma-specific STIG1-like protein 4 [Malania oleifera]
MMQLSSSPKELAIPMLLLLLVSTLVEGEGDPSLANAQNARAREALPSSSQWLEKTLMGPRASGCSKRPWLCYKRALLGERMECCKNRCIDLASDFNNCGLCGVRCPFGWKCCEGYCIDITLNPLHCGKCGNECPIGVLCSYGMCGYSLD